VRRLSEFKNFSQHSAPEGKTLVCAEITCNYDDETWNMDREKLIELAAGDLERVGLIRGAEVEGAFIHRERFSYPLYDLIYRQHVKTCMDWMKSLQNFHSTGRQGLFQYGNMDHSIAMGMVLADRLVGSLGGEGQEDQDHDKLLVGEEHVD
jgi:protoporphyrinogen oxidase